MSACSVAADPAEDRAGGEQSAAVYYRSRLLPVGGQALEGGKITGAAFMAHPHFEKSFGT